jgi:ATP-binding cassette subfamily C protein
MLSPEPLRIARLIALVRRETGRNFDKAALLQIVGALTEALSVALLIPLLHVIGKGAVPLRIPILGMSFTPSLPMVLCAFVVLIIVRSLALERKEAFNARVTFGFAEKMSGKLFAALAATRWSAVSNWRTADMTHAVTGDSDRLLQTINLLLSFVQSLAMAAIFTCLSLLLSWQMTLLAVGVGLALLVVTLPGRDRILRKGRRLAEARQAQFRIIDEFFNGLRTAKAFGLEDRHVAAMNDVLREIRDGNVSFTAMRARTATVYQIATAVALTGFIWFALSVAGLGLAKIVALLFLYMRLAPRIISLHTSLQELCAQIGGVEAMLGVLDQAERNRERIPQESLETPRLRHCLEIRDITYRYEGAERMALERIDVTIPAHAITALVGPTGSGKSTLVDLVLGLIEPDEGAIAIDGELLEAGNRAGWRRRVAYVPQETFLFNATIAENLRLAQAEATEAALWNALQIADAANFVKALPGGLEHRIGDRGRGLSGGERQRLAIARALLREPDLLILDEATSALDALSQRRVAQAIAGLRDRMTIVAVAHRPSMVGFADNVIVLENGKVTASGPLDQVIREEAGHIREVIDAEGNFAYTNK